MRNEHTIAVIIPALNEESSIGLVLRDIPAWVDDVIVVDNGSSDRTAEIARAGGARVVVEPERGYGAACLRGIAALRAPDIVVFLDGDHSDHPEEMPLLVDPVINGDVDFMVGSRVRGAREAGALTPQATFGNWLATRLIRLFWGIRYTDLGPFRAIRYRTLRQLEMSDRDFGWTVEMQIKAALRAVAADEVPVSYRRRIGVSKISGTLRGSVRAGAKILGLIAANVLFGQPRLKSGLMVFFTRYPEPGATKTRLIPVLGPSGAADLQREMAAFCLRVAPPPLDYVDVEVCHTGAPAGAFRRWLGPEFLYAEQAEGDLGVRLAQAFERAFHQAYGKVVLCGTDCPALSARHGAEAFAALDQADMVLGPAEDGGFYLIGMNFAAALESMEALFAEVAWGGPDVLRRVTENAEQLKLSIHLLERLQDIDVPEDLSEWERARTAARISVIVPAPEEPSTMQPLLDQLEGIPDVETVIVHGDSSGDPMRAGAEKASGGILYFLPPHCRPPVDFARTIRQVLSFPDIALGAFPARAGGRRSLFVIGGPGAGVAETGFYLRRETWDTLLATEHGAPMHEAVPRAVQAVGRVLVTGGEIEIVEPRGAKPSDH